MCVCVCVFIRNGSGNENAYWIVLLYLNSFWIKSVQIVIRRNFRDERKVTKIKEKHGSTFNETKTLNLKAIRIVVDVLLCAFIVRTFWQSLVIHNFSSSSTPIFFSLFYFKLTICLFHSDSMRIELDLVWSNG